MIRVDVEDARSDLSRCLELVERGEVVVLCRRGVAVAEVRALPARPSEPRPIGLYRGRIRVADSFDDPLPPGIREAFGGGPQGIG